MRVKVVFSNKVQIVQLCTFWCRLISSEGELLFLNFVRDLPLRLGNRHGFDGKSIKLVPKNPLQKNPGTVAEASSGEDPLAAAMKT